MSNHSTKSRALAVIGSLALAVPLLATAQAASADDVLDAGTHLYVNPQSTTLVAAAGLQGQARADAQLLGSFASANWFTNGTPNEVKAKVNALVTSAAAADSVPVLVAYNLPFRDCSQYSAGGAADTAAYNAWIDAFAQGIGGRSAVVILEPDGLGIIPWYTTVNGDQEWCQPAEANQATAADDRFAQLNHAVDSLSALSHTAVYLDGTHSGWLGVGDISDRLIKAGVAKADGFFLNASNYVATNRLEKYGSWVSDCIYLSANSWWQPQWCASQYYPANPADFSTWGQSDAAYDQAFSDTDLTRNPGEQKHLVIDTSRNGQGPWVAPSGVYSDAEDWCNPPGRGLGIAPTTASSNPLIDAYLWIKVPGESDGQCYRGTGGPLDPERGIKDPAAGAWFAAQAHELIDLASPAVAAQKCDIDYTVNGTWSNGSNTQVWIKNTGSSAISGWNLRWTFDGSEHIDNLWSGSLTQSGKSVSVKNLDWNKSIAPGASLTFGFITSGTTGAEPLLFTLNGKPCTSH
jgi:endoglucanase